MKAFDRIANKFRFVIVTSVINFSHIRPEDNAYSYTYFILDAVEIVVISYLKEAVSL
jgi:meiotically up-regulated gene 157 (Mug157) protein